MFPFSAPRPRAVDRTPRDPTPVARDLCVGALLGLAWLNAGRAAAQQLMRPENNWGDMPVDLPPPLLGGPEILTALVVSLFVLCGYGAWQLWRIGALRRLLRGPAGTPVIPTEPVARGELIDELDRWAPFLPWVTLVLAPLVGLAAIVLGRSHRILGVEIALLALGLATTTAILGTCARFLVTDLQQRAAPD
ncbi:MAG: hypothetical protein AAGC60_08705 [Acidobacteriota bacterium]